MTVEQWLGKENTLGVSIWKNKYQHNNESFDEWLERVSAGNENVKKLIIEKKFLFGGRILAHRGLPKRDGKKVCYSNCFVDSLGDSIEEIFECAKRMARTYASGGGVGISIGPLSPRGAKIRNAANKTTGAVSFMDLYSMITEIIGAEGRRGALMISIPVSHPDIEEFIDVKNDLNRVTKANISIMVDDGFMRAVKERAKYKCYFKREETGEEIVKYVDAYKLFKKLAENNWRMAEPGILYWSTIENYHLQSNTPEFKFAGTNPCAEEPLMDGGSCLLGSINLDAFVDRNTKKFNDLEFEKCVRFATIALNEVQRENIELLPLEKQRLNAEKWRQIGLGIMGLADCLIHMRIEYGSEESILVCNHIASIMANASIGESASLAKKYSSYEKYNYEQVSSTKYYRNVVNENIDKIVRKNGLYNSQILTIAPTGSLSTMLQVSGGIEPIFANFYTRKTESLHGKDTYYKVYTKIVKEYMDEHGLKDDSELPDYFVTAQTLDWHNRLLMQSTWQRYIDASISSTVNLPNSATVEDVFNLYMEAYDLGLKGVTIFRDGCERAGILTLGTESKKEEDSSTKFNTVKPVSRKEMGITHGDTYCKKCACGTLYITVNRDDDGNIVELFVHTSKGGICQANISALTRMASLSLRAGVLVDEVIDQLRAISCPACNVTKAKGKPIDGMSCPDIISRVLQSAYDKGREIKKSDKTAKQEEKTVEEVKDEYKCPECGTKLSMSGGCRTCTECGWSKCE